MEQILSLQHLSSQNIVLKELVNIVKQAKESKNCKGLIKHIILNSPLLLILILLEHIVRNPEKLIGFLKTNLLNLFYKIVYRKLEINFDEKDMVFSFVDVCKKNTSSLMYLSEINGAQYVHYVPFFSKYKKIHSDFLFHYKINKSKIKTCKLEFDKDKKVYLKTTDEEIYFPCKNHVRIISMIENRLEEIKITKCYKTVGILINSVPGLAKTYTIDNIAAHNIVQKCHYIKMNSFTDTDFLNIFNQCISPAKVPTVYMIDELDKYLYHYMEKSYLKYLDTIRSKKSVPLSFDQYSKITKDKVIIEITEILDSRKNTAPCFIIFCSNNFDTIFEGSNIKHVKSLLSRFLRVTYEYCDNKELLTYLLFYNSLRKDTKRYFNDEDIIKAVENMPSFNITYRYLDHVSKICNNNPLEIVEIIKDGKYEFYDIQEENDEQYINDIKCRTQEHYERVINEKTRNPIQIIENKESKSPKINQSKSKTNQSESKINQSESKINQSESKINQSESKINRSDFNTIKDDIDENEDFGDDNQDIEDENEDFGDENQDVEDENQDFGDDNQEFNEENQGDVDENEKCFPNQDDFDKIKMVVDNSEAVINSNPKYLFDADCVGNSDYPEILGGYYTKYTFSEYEIENESFSKNHYTKIIGILLNEIKISALIEKIVILIRLFDFIERYNGSIQFLKSRPSFLRAIFSKFDEFKKVKKYGPLIASKIENLEEIIKNISEDE